MKFYKPFLPICTICDHATMLHYELSIEKKSKTFFKKMGFGLSLHFQCSINCEFATVL